MGLMQSYRRPQIIDPEPDPERYEERSQIVETAGRSIHEERPKTIAIADPEADPERHEERRQIVETTDPEPDPEVICRSNSSSYCDQSLGF